MSGEASGAAAVKNGDVKGDSSLNLFRIPHTRMKELVSWPLKGVQDLDVQDLEPSLQVTIHLCTVRSAFFIYLFVLSSSFCVLTKSKSWT